VGVKEYLALPQFSGGEKAKKQKNASNFRKTLWERGHWGLSETEKPATIFTKTEKPDEKSLKTEKTPRIMIKTANSRFSIPQPLI